MSGVDMKGNPEREKGKEEWKIEKESERLQFQIKGGSKRGNGNIEGENLAEGGKAGERKRR